MSILESGISNRGAEFEQNRAAMQALVEDLREKTAAIDAGGGVRSIWCTECR